MKLIFWTLLSMLACSSLTHYNVASDNILAKKTDVSFEGRWSWVHNNEKRDFNVTIHHDKDTLNGTYCSVMQYGSRIDCGDGAVSFSTKIPEGNTLATDFNTFYRRGVGTIKLTLIHEDTLKWIITERPSVPCFAPDSAMLIREKE